MSLFDDSFEGYTLGAGVPAFPGNLGGWFNISGGGQIITDPPPFSFKGPSLPTSSKCMFLGGIGNVGPGPLFNGVLTFSVFMDLGSGFVPTPFCSIINSFYPNPTVPPLWTGPYTANMLNLIIHPDLSISLSTNAGYMLDPTLHLPANSGFAAGSILGNSVTLHRGVWHMLQLIFSLSAFPGPEITASGMVLVDGQLAATGGSTDTTYNTNSGFVDPKGVHIIPPTGLANGIAFQGAGGFVVESAIDNVTVDVLGSTWPHPASPPGPNALVSQLVVEYAKQENANARDSQLVVEYASIPYRTVSKLDANARDSQLVVEIMGSGTGPSNPGRWLVKES